MFGYFIDKERRVRYHTFMNKKKLNTKEKIYGAFRLVLQEKKYADINVQDILDRSGIARSTFYAHYKTKDDLLHSICSTIFEHVFSHSLSEEKSHDFSKASIFEYKHFITHIFYHLHDEKELIFAIFSSESKSVFVDYLRTALFPLAEICIKSNFVPTKDIPEKIRVASAVENFIVLVQYWIDEGFATVPEILTEFFIKMNS